jgi:hypothetical protein
MCISYLVQKILKIINTNLANTLNFVKKNIENLRKKIHMPHIEAGFHYQNINEQSSSVQH